MKHLDVTMADGSVWRVPGWVIATHRAKYFKEKEGDDSGAQEYEYTLYDGDTMKDWAENNMNWSNVKPFAKQVKPASVDHQEGWVKGKKEVVEV